MTKKEKSVMVVGGGIAGIQASLDLADSGIKVYLIESSPSLGGRMVQLDKTFPTNDCSMCIISPKLVDTNRHPNIQLLTLSEVKNVEGKVGNFTVTILKHPRYVNEEKCVGCGTCAEKCPSKVSNEFDIDIAYRKAIYVPFPQATPLKFLIDKKNCIYFKMKEKGKEDVCMLCVKACEAKAVDHNMKEEEIKIDVGSIILTTGSELFDARLKPEYYSDEYDNVITSIEFERYLSASGPSQGKIVRPSDNIQPKKIAWIQCVGSRDEKIGKVYCSSVCCTYATKEAILTKEHSPTTECKIFFMDMRTYGKGFEEYYNRAEGIGVEYIRCRVPQIEEIPSNRNLIIRYRDESGNLKKDIFDLVVLSIGFSQEKNIKKLSKICDIELNEYDFCKTDIFSPLETSKKGIFVSGVFSEPKDIPDTVAQASGASAKASTIVSGGNKLSFNKKSELEIDVTEEEARIGVFVCHCGINIGNIVNVPNIVEYVKTLPNVVHVEGNLYSCSQGVQEDIKAKIKKYKLNRIVVASCSPRTHASLFQETISEAGLNPYLFEMANIREQCSWVHMNEKEKANKKAKDLIRGSVAKAKLLKPLKKFKISVNKTALIIGAGLSGITASLELAEQGFEVHLIEKEKEIGGNLRNIQYLPEGQNPQKHLKDIIQKIHSSEKIILHTSSQVINVDGYVGNFITTFNENGINKFINNGVIIVATGGREYKPIEYYYGKNKKVITQLELEDKLVKNKMNSKNIVMIQCVGSRNEKRIYCSRICCTEAVKNALKIKEINPNSQIYILFRDVRTYGFREKFYKKARENGIVFLRYEKEKKPDVKLENDEITVHVDDYVTNNRIILHPDLLVLSSATISHDENKNLSSLLKVPLNKDGFFFEAHKKLRPIDFSTNGIFLCGLAHSPKFIDESLSQAYGTVSRALTILSKNELEVGGSVAVVDYDKCTTCLTCIRLCPYKAPYINKEGVAEIEKAKCQGCGTCASECPAKAIQLNYYTDDQMIAKCSALLNT